MNTIILTTREELVEIIDTCFTKHFLKLIEPSKEPDQKLLHSLRELADFLGCSVVTAQHLKNSGKIRYKQFGRKVIFNTADVLEDLDQKQ
jgi:hypothetical protein